MEGLTPAAIVAELDRYIVGQQAAKRTIAIALRSRMRRGQLPAAMRDEVSPKNILMIGPTGVGKTEIARRVARLVDAPFIKVEATRFTEVGFVGRDVESIIRDLVEVSLDRVDTQRFEQVRPQAEESALERLAGYLLDQRPAARRPRRSATAETSGRSETRRQQRQRILAQLRDRQLEAEMVEIDVEYLPADDVIITAGDFGQPESFNRATRRGKASLPQRQSRRVSVAEARRILTEQEADQLIDWDGVADEAIRRVEEGGIIFLDEVDKLVGSGGDYSPRVSDEGVQRDLLPIIEGSAVITPYGPVQTEHILFVAAGAFTAARPSDLLPEFQGRFPLRVEFDALQADDLYAILTEPENSLVRQYTALLATEGVTLEFAPDGLREIADLAATLNERQEDIGARRLATILERVLEEVSFDAPALTGETLTIDAAFVLGRFDDILDDEDLNRFIL